MARGYIPRNLVAPATRVPLSSIHRNNEGQYSEAKAQQGLLINRDRLEEATESQPDLFYQVSDELAVVISRRDAAKLELKREKAEASRRVITVIESNDEKVTDTRVEHYIALDSKVQIAEAKLADLDLEVGRLFALKEAYQDRSKMLEQLVKLWLNNYYSSNISDNASRDYRADVNRREISRLDREARQGRVK